MNALSRKEQITVLYRGRPVATMKPIGAWVEGRGPAASKHASFGIWADHDQFR